MLFCKAQNEHTQDITLVGIHSNNTMVQVYQKHFKRYIFTGFENKSCL